MHTDILRRRIKHEQALNVSEFYDASHMHMYQVLHRALQAQLASHSQHKWAIQAPLMILQNVFPLDAMVPGRQCDAMDCFVHFYRSLGYDYGNGQGDEDVWLYDSNA